MLSKCRYCKAKCRTRGFILRILVSNDDGFNADGIQTLINTLKKDHEVFMCAPHTERSGTGHGLSFMETLKIVKIDTNLYSCSGLPADCVLFGLKELFKDIKFDLVVSGINRGANLGLDTYYSGTAAAAREGVLRGIPAIAVSLCCDFPKKSEGFYYNSAANYISKIIDNGVVDVIPKDTFLNINIPNCELENISDITFSQMGKRMFYVGFKEGSQDEYSYDSYMSSYMEIPDSDCVHVAENKISILPINVFSGFTDKGLSDCFDRVFK